MATFPTSTIIHIKRKRDDTPIDSLYLESASKRPRASTFTPKVFFKRLPASTPLTQLPPAPPAAPVPAHTRDAIIRGPDGVPEILGSPEGEEERDPLALRQAARVRGDRPVGRHVVVQSGEEGARPRFAIAKAEGLEPMEVDGGEFVYDVFVRENVRPGGSVTKGWLGVKEGVSGTLLVGDEHAEWLENYFWEGEGEEEDRVWSDDEDSNAEDYYGADYPEDEDSDDSGDDEYEREEYVADYDDHFNAMSYR